MRAVTLELMDSLNEAKFASGFVASELIWSVKSCTEETEHTWLCFVHF